MKDQLISILQEIHDDVDYENCKTLIDDGLLASLDIIQLIYVLSDTFDVEIPAKEIIPANFNSLANMEIMIRRLMEDE